MSAEAVSHWLGGWHVARDAAGCSDVSGSNRTDWASPPVSGGAIPEGLVWTQSAVCDCDRVRRLLASLRPDGTQAVRRLDSLLVAAMVRLIADGANGLDGVADVILLPAIALRILTKDGRAIVLGLHGVAPIT